MQNIIKNKNTLNSEELNDLIRRNIKGDTRAREKLIESYLYLPFEVAKSSMFTLAPVDEQDLISAGFIAIIKAVDKYMIGGTETFESYLRLNIVNEMKDACTHYIKCMGEDTLSLEEIKEKELSGNSQIYDERSDMTLKMEREATLNQIKSIISKLNPDYRLILELYFGFTAEGEPLSTDEISRLLHQSYDYVDSIIKICVNSIKAAIGLNGQINLYISNDLNLESKKQK